MASRFHIPSPIRPIVERFARVVCPPGPGGIDAPGRMAELYNQLEPFLGAMPRHLQLGVMASFVTFDQAARLWPRALGRRFTALDDARADAYFRAMAHGPLGPQRAICKLMKGLATFNYYEIPAVRAELEYHPDAYIAKVAKRRLESYAEAIRKGEEVVLAAEPGQVVKLRTRVTR